MRTPFHQRYNNNNKKNKLFIHKQQQQQRSSTFISTKKCYHFIFIIYMIMIIFDHQMVNALNIRTNIQNKKPGEPAKRAPPQKLLDAIFGKKNSNVMVDQMKYNPPPGKIKEVDKKADTFLFDTVHKYQAEEKKKDAIKKKLHKEIDSKTIKGPILNFYKAVEKQRFKASHPMYNFNKALELQEKKKLKDKAHLRIKEERAKVLFRFKTGEIKNPRKELVRMEREYRFKQEQQQQQHKNGEKNDLKNKHTLTKPHVVASKNEKLLRFKNNKKNLNKKNQEDKNKDNNGESGEDQYVITNAKKEDTPQDTQVPGSKNADQINKVFRDLENKVNEKAEDPMKDTGNGKDSPIKQTQKWWDIRNWDHEVLERMTNSQWQGEAQIDDGGRTSPTNVKREPDFLKRLDEFASMEQKDDHLEYYKKDRPYSYGGARLGRPVEFNVQGMPQWTRKETWKRGDPRNGVMYGEGLRPCFTNCNQDDETPVDGLPNKKEIFRSPLAPGRAKGILQANGIVAATPEDTYQRVLNHASELASRSNNMQ